MRVGRLLQGICQFGSEAYAVAAGFRLPQVIRSRRPVAFPLLGPSPRMRHILAFAFTVLLALPAAAKPPNVVLVMADDQGWGDMAYNGHPTVKTPHFDAMAKEALRFDGFHAAAPVCSPTRASFWGDSSRRAGPALAPPGPPPPPFPPP